MGRVSKKEASWEPRGNILDPRLLEHFRERHMVLFLQPTSVGGLHSASIHRGGYGRYVTFSLSIIMRIVMFLTTLSNILTVASVPEVGPVFDCTKVSQGKIYQLDDDLTCDNTIGQKFGAYTTFHAKVQQYYLTRTTHKLYHCSHVQVSLTCKENFFAGKERHLRCDHIKVSATDCLEAERTLMSIAGELHAVNDNHFVTFSTDGYSCYWLRTITHIFHHLELRVSTSYIEGRNNEIHQSLTKTSCQYNEFSCVPQEEPLSVVVWKNASHDATSFHTIGTYPIQRVGDYMLIPPLNIGGAIQLEQNDGNFKQLDNNYVILRNSSSVNTSRLPDFYTLAKEQASKTSSGEHAALLTGYLVATFDIIFQNSRALWHHSCQLKTEILHLRQ